MKLKSLNIYSIESNIAHLSKVIEMQAVCTDLEGHLNKYYKDQLLRDSEVMK